jgi:secreted trypsin-like serine protease
LQARDPNRKVCDGWAPIGGGHRRAADGRDGGYGENVLQRLIRGLALAALAVAVSAGAASPAVRVVGGTAIQIQSAPWTVFVAYYPGGDTQYQCTGSVLDASTILTAAHCLYGPTGTLAQPAQVSVEAGVSNYAAPASTDAEQDRAVSSFRIHPGYVFQEGGLPDDLAVLTLSTPLDLSGPAVQAVALPAANAPYPVGAAVSLAGFGLMNGADPTSTAPLESMTGTVEPQGQCGEYTQSSLLEMNNAVVMCVSSPTSAVCNGDSGSGIVATGGTPTLIGISDAGQPGCPAASPDIAAYAGAPEILQFIEGNNQPPLAPRPSAQTTYRLTWAQPLVVGATVVCSTSGWPEPVQTVFTFVNNSTGAVLQTGPIGRYVLPASSVGTEVACDVAVTDSGGTTLVETTASSTIEAVPKATFHPLPPVTAARGGVVTLHPVLRIPLGLKGTYTVCATLPTVDGGRACKSIREAFGVSGSFPFTLTLRLKRTARIGTARVAISALAGGSTVKATELLRIQKP